MGEGKRMFDPGDRARAERNGVTDQTLRQIMREEMTKARRVEKRSRPMGPIEILDITTGRKAE
jgi:hypothetical protein